MQKIFNAVKTFPYLDALKNYIKHNILMIVLFMFLAIYFYNFPSVDLIISSAFYTDTQGFLLRLSPLSNLIFFAVNYTATALIIIFVAYLILTTMFRRRIFNISRKAVLFLLLAMALAPGLVVNEILKDNMGRARPDRIIEFGGDKIFTPPFMASNQCKENCSFVSGHASFGFYLMAFGFLATGTRRKILFLGGFLIGTVVGATRIMDGRHFFTDVLFSFFFVYLTIALLYEIMYYKKDSKSDQPIS